MNNKSSYSAEAYLGRGWSFPPRWHASTDEAGNDLKDDIDVDDRFACTQLSTGLDDIRQSIRIILGTRIGERVMEPDFGSRLYAYVFQPLVPRTCNLVASEVKRALLRWERRIINIDVQTNVSAQEVGRLDVDISFDIDTHRLRQNFIYPFYVQHPEGR